MSNVPETIEMIDVDAAHVDMIAVAISQASLIPDQCVCGASPPHARGDVACRTQALPRLLTNISAPLVGLASGLQAWLDAHPDFHIEGPSQYAHWIDALGRAKGVAKTLEEKRLVLTRPVDEMKQTIMDRFREPLTWLDRVVEIIESALKVYHTEAQAELRRREAEKQASQRTRCDDNALETALLLDKAGRPAAAERHLRLAIDAPPPNVHIVDPLPPARGSVTPVIVHEIHDARALIDECRHAVDDAVEILDDPERAGEAMDALLYAQDLLTEHHDLLILDVAAVKARVASLGLQTRIPGVRVWQEDRINVRAKRMR